MRVGGDSLRSHSSAAQHSIRSMHECHCLNQCVIGELFFFKHLFSYVNNTGLALKIGQIREEEMGFQNLAYCGHGLRFSG